MKKTMISFLLMLTAITASAQSTARKFVLKNSSDGQSELTCYLPKNPSGRAVVDCPEVGILILQWTMRDISGQNISTNRVSLSLS